MTKLPIHVNEAGRGIWLDLLTFGRARLNIGPLDDCSYDEGW